MANNPPQKSAPQSQKSAELDPEKVGKFRDLAEKRLPKLFKGFDALANLGSSNYHRPDSDLRDMADAIQAKFNETMSILRGAKRNAPPVFQFKR